MCFAMCFVAGIRIDRWYKSVRSSYGRIKKEFQKSGNAPLVLKYRAAWIWKHLDFLKPYVRNKTPSVIMSWVSIGDCVWIEDEVISNWRVLLWCIIHSIFPLPFNLFQRFQMDSLALVNRYLGMAQRGRTPTRPSCTHSYSCSNCRWHVLSASTNSSTLSTTPPVSPTPM